MANGPPFLVLLLIHVAYRFSWASVLTLVICSIVTMINLNPLVLLLSIVGLFFALLISLLEVPFFTRCCPVSERVTSWAETLRKNEFRGLAYVGMATIMWLNTLGIFGGGTAMIAPAFFLTLTGFCYSLSFILIYIYVDH